MKFGPGDIRTGKRWYAVQTKHYLIMFDEVARKLVKPERFAAAAEARLAKIAAILGLSKDKADGRYAIRGVIPYFVHDPKVLNYGNVEAGGIDVPAAGYKVDFYQHEEAHAVLHQAVGGPPAFFNEGFACFASRPKDDENHRCSLVGIRHEVVPRLGDIAWSGGFWKRYPIYKPFMYRIAGSFVAWTFAEFGKEPFLRFAARCGFQATRQQVLREFRKAYGTSLRSAERQWKAWLYSRRNGLTMSTRRRMGNISQTEWERTRVQMVHDALDTK